MKILIFIYIFCLSTSLFGDNNTLNTKATIDSLKAEQIRIKNNLKNIDNNIAKLLQNSNSESIESLAIKIDSIKINKDKYLSRLSIINIQVDSLTKHLTELILQKPIESFKGIIKQTTGLYKNPIQYRGDRITTVTIGEVVDIIDISKSKYFVKINYNDNTGFVHVFDILTDKEKLSKLQSRADAIKKSKDFENKKISSELSEKQNKSSADHSKRNDQKYSNLGFEVISFYSKWEGDRLRVIGEVKNITNSAKGVQVEAIARDSNGNLIESAKFWPASIRNIPPGQTTGIGHTVTHDKRATKVELRIIDTMVW